MAGTRYIRRDRVIRLRRAEADQGALLEFVDGERVIRHVVRPATVAALIAQSTTTHVAQALWSGPAIRGELIQWQQARATTMEGPLPYGEQRIDRLCLRVEDDRLTALPLEQALLPVLAATGLSSLSIPRLVPVPPRVAQVPFTLPLRLLQLDQRADFDLPHTINAVFGTHMGGRNLASAMQVKKDRARRFSHWRLPSRWKTVDILHLDQLTILPERRLLSMSAPGEVGTLGWLVRCVDLWRTRLMVIRGNGASEMALLRRLAHRLVAQGGPAIWLVDGAGTDAQQRLARLYDKLIHDAPIDLAVAIAVGGPPSPGSDNDTLIVGCGREELVRVSVPGDDVVTLTLGLRDPDPSTRAEVAGRLWSYVAGSGRDLGDAAVAFAKTIRGLEGISTALPSLNFDIHEGDGLIPLGTRIGRLRQTTRVAAAPPGELRPTPDRSGPRYVNPTLWQLDPATGRKQPIPQRAARLRQGEPIVLGVQLGPHTGYTPVLDATALIEEPFKWEEGREGVWLSVGLTSLDFVATGALIQEVWLPRYGASDVVEFMVEPTQPGISQLRFCIYYGADLLQSHRLAAVVENATGTGGTTSELAAALDVAAERVGDAGWCARMEYAAAVDLASPPAPASRDVALSIFANDLGGRRVFTVRGTEGYEVLLAGDTSDMASAIRARLDAVSRDQYNLYAFRNGTPLHSGTPEQRDAALHDLAHVGWTLFAAIFASVDRETMAADLAGERRIIHIAHALLESVIPWAAVYDRPYDIDRQRDDAGRPVLRDVCPAGLPDAAGKFPATVCGTASNCPLSPQGRTAAAAAGKGVVEDTIVCARSFWGFRHIVELPPYQEDGPTATSTMTTIVAAGTTAPPPRRRVTTAGNPVQLLLGYNAGLGSAQSHRTALQKLLAGRKLNAVWQAEENSRDGFLTALRHADADLVYLFCHARGGLADLTTKPPALELQESAHSQPSLIRAAALANGLHLTHHPLVILNGCNTAVFSPDALSPFIRTLVRDCDAAGALGTEIPVFEVFAGEVACRFIRRFLDGQKAGEALLGIRCELLADGNPLGLIYTLYAVAELEIAQ